jgi:hypothetical protein
MTILALGLALVVFSVAGLAVDGTRAFLTRRTLQSAADSAALAGAGSIDVRSLYASGGRKVLLDPAAARREALVWLDLRGLPVTREVVAGSGGIAVLLEGEVETTWLGLIGIDRVPVVVRSRSAATRGSSTVTRPSSRAKAVVQRALGFLLLRPLSDDCEPALWDCRGCIPWRA